MFNFTYFGYPKGCLSNSLRLSNGDIVLYNTSINISDKDMQQILSEKLSITFDDLKNQGVVDWEQISVDPITTDDIKPDIESPSEEIPEAPEVQKTSNNKNTNRNQ